MAVLSTAGAGHGDEGGTQGKRRPFKGTSSKGDFQEALRLAVQAAQKAAGPDRRIDWSLKQTEGRAGTIAGFNEVTVTIEASIT